MSAVGDILVHFSVVQPLGRRSLPEGARVMCRTVGARPRAAGVRDIVDRPDRRGRAAAPRAARPRPGRSRRDDRRRRAVRAGRGEVVQPAERIRLPDSRRGRRGHLRAHGNAAPRGGSRRSSRASRYARGWWTAARGRSPPRWIARTGSPISEHPDRRRPSFVVRPSAVAACATRR